LRTLFLSRLTKMILVLGAMLIGPGLFAAKADTIFNITSTFTNGATLSGTISINTSTGLVGSGSFLIAGNTYTFSGFQSVEGPGGGTEYLAFFTDALGDHLDIIFPTNSLVGYAGGFLCSTALGQTCNDPTQFGNTANGITFLAQGGTSSTNSVPEPSSLLLLAGGLVGLGLLSRKMHFASGKA
jgi:PEP-CTERM motif